MGERNTPFHVVSYKFLASLDDSRKLFSNLVDVFSAIAARDFTNDWAPDMAQRCFRFNRAQKKFQHDMREWVDSITEQEVEMVGRWLGYRSADRRITSPHMGGEQDRYDTKKTSASRSSGKTKKKSATIKGKATRRR